MQRYFYDSIDSTNLEARRLWVQLYEHVEETGVEPVVVVARQQSAGMGRAGRTWLSPAGGLWLSLAWPLRHDLGCYQALPLVAGLACAQALESSFSLDCCIKWPNDILVGGRKLVGILCQSELRPSLPPMIVIGIGVNGNFEASALGPGLRQEPVSLLDLVGHPVDLEAFESRLVRGLEEALAAYEEGLFDAALLPEVRRRLAWLGEHVGCVEPAGTILAEGRLVGLDGDGRLEIETPKGLVALAIGEIHLSASPPPVDSR